MIYKRLERDGEIWEIWLEEKRVIESREDALEKTEHASVEKAQFHVADQVRDRQRRGFRETAYEEHYEGGAREPALEAAIAAAPDDPTTYLVYADWLQQHGEPRGELIALQHALLGDPDNAALCEREAALFDAHSDRLLGPLALVGNARAEWYCGFVRVLALDIWLQAMGRTLLAPLLVHPSMQFLVELEGNAAEDTALLPLAEHAPATLARIDLANVNYPQRIRLQAAFRESRRELPRLTQLRLGAVRHASLAEFLSASSASHHRRS